MPTMALLVFVGTGCSGAGRVRGPEPTADAAEPFRVCRDRLAPYALLSGHPEPQSPYSQIERIEQLLSPGCVSGEAHAELLLRLGDLRCGVGDYKGAITTLSSLKEWYPEYVHADWALLTLAVALERDGQTEAASAEYRSFIDTFPASPLVSDAEVAIHRLYRPGDEDRAAP